MFSRDCDLERCMVLTIMNYQRIHDQIIERAKSENRQKGGDVYYERHHIIPSSFGGSNKKENLVLLTAREHFIVHKLLCEIYPDNKYALKGYYLMAAGHTMGNRLGEYRVGAREYERLRKAFSDANKGEKNHFYGKTHTPGVRAKLSKIHKGKIGHWTGLTKDTRPGLKKISEMPRWNAGLTKESDDRVRELGKKISAALTGKKRGKYNVKRVVCQYCNKTISLSVHNRQHGKKCKKYLDS